MKNKSLSKKGFIIFGEIVKIEEHIVIIKHDDGTSTPVFFDLADEAFEKIDLKLNTMVGLPCIEV